MQLRGRRALVTGATGGLGHAIARALAERGAQLVISGRRSEVLEPLGAELGAEIVTADLADRAALTPFLDRVGNVDVLVANAALPASGDISDYTEEQIDRALDVNLRAPILLARKVSADMVARKAGHIVFVSSLSGKIAQSGSALYSATKFGMRGFAQGLRQDLDGTGVGVSCVFPGPIVDAGMFADTGEVLPFYALPKRPPHVGAAVVRAIERNRAEVDVAALPMRLAANMASAVPGPVTALQRRLGSDDIAARVSDAQRDKR